MKKNIVNQNFHHIASAIMEACANEKELKKVVEEIGSLICLKTLHGELTKEQKKLLKKHERNLIPMGDLIDLELAKLPEDEWFEHGAEWCAILKFEEKFIKWNGVMDLWLD